MKYQIFNTGIKLKKQQKNSSNPLRDLTLTKCNDGKVVELFFRQTATSVKNEEAVEQSSNFRPRDLVSVGKWLTILHHHR